MKIRYFIVALMVCFVCQWVVAQSGNTVLNIPEKYLTPEEFTQPVNEIYYDPPRPDDRRHSRRLWVVWSDRINNNTYTTHNGNTVKDVLDFLDPLTVLEVRGDRLRVARLSDVDVDNRRLKTGRSDIGWIDHENLLLWNSTIMNTKQGIEKKAMVINVFVPGQDIGQNIPQLYKNVPNTVPETQLLSNQAVSEYQIFQVYKETNAALLVGQRFFINTAGETNARDVIRGWVKKEQSTPWNHRTGVEWDWKTSTGRLSQATVWERIDGVENFDEPTIQSEPKPYSRRPSIYNRYPVLDPVREGETPDLTRPVRIGVVGPMFSIESEQEIPETFVDDIFDAIETINQKLRNINIVFVIDATKSMEPYAKPVGNALRKVMADIRQREANADEQDRKTYRFGALLFRDEPEEHVIHVSNNNRLTEDPAIINSFLTEYMIPRYNVRSRDLPESMFNGIQQAVRQFSLVPQQSNYIIIIGDAGDHQNRAGKPNTFRTDQQVINALAGIEANVLAYQVFNNQRINPMTRQPVPADTIYETFQKQLKHVIQQTGVALFDAGQREEARQVRWEEIAPNHFQLKNAPIMGELVVPNVNDSIRLSELDNMLADRINTIDVYTNQEIERLKDFFDGQFTAEEMDDIELSDGVRRLMFVLLRQIDTIERRRPPDNPLTFGEKQEIIETILRGGARQIYQEGYTIYSYNSEDWYQLVILLARSNLNELIEAIRGLAIDHLTCAVQRQRLANVMRRMIASYLGDVPDPDNIQLSVIMQRIVGARINVPGGEKTINDIINIEVTSCDDIRALTRSYTVILQKLQEIFDKGSKYDGFVSNSQQGYNWIPTAIFEGN